MAPTRGRSTMGLSEGDEDESRRSPKGQRLSNGSRASGSTVGASPTTDVEDEEMLDSEQSVRTGKGKGKRRAAPASDGEEDHEDHDSQKRHEDVAFKAKKMADLCKEQEEEDSRLGLDENGDTGGPDGKENRSLSSRPKNGITAGAHPKPEGRRTTDAGVVLKIHVSNFMCHRKLTVQLCKQVNFINGRNGSGKSAILAAIQICLGAKAHLTHRAKKLSDFIRHGWTGDAILEVTLLNSSEGFKFEEYGESITVQRTIRQPSGGGFALLDHDGKVKSRDKKELHRMLDVLNIQVDNPCAVLDQENSKKFLQGSERDKYAFFMKATDLDRILADSEETGAAITRMKIGHHQAVDQIPKFKKTTVQLMDELKAYTGLEALEKKVKSLKEQMAWKHVELAEEYAASMQEEVKLKDLHIQGLVKKMGEASEFLTKFTTRKEQAKEQFDKKVAIADKLKADVMKTTSDLTIAQEPLLVLNAERATLQSERRKKADNKARAERNLAEAREKTRRNASDEKEKRLLEEIQQADNKLKRIAQQKAAGGGSEDRVYTLRHALSTSKEAANRAQQEYQQLQKELAARQQDLRNLSTEAFNPLRALGNYMPDLVNYIRQNSNKFRTPPVGPIGASIQLKEEYKGYRICIEGHIKNSLQTFVVASQPDKTSLMVLMKAFRQRYRGNFPLPTIVVQAATGRHKPPQNPAGYLQIMQAIIVTDDQAFNALVDQASIEKHCLFSSKEAAEQACLIGRSGSYQRMPHGMFEAYYPSVGGRSCSKFSVSDGNIQTRMNMVNADKHRRVLGVDEGTLRQEAEAQLRQADDAATAARAVAHAEGRKHTQAQVTLEREEASRSQLANQENMLLREKQRLQKDHMAVQSLRTVDDETEKYEGALEEANEELDSAVKDLANLEGHMRETAAQIEPYKQARAAVKLAHQAATQECQNMSDMFEDEGAQEARQHHALGRIKASLTKTEQQLRSISADKDEADKKRESALTMAEGYIKNMRSAAGEDWDGRRDISSHSLETLQNKTHVAKQRLEKERQERKVRGKSKAEVEKQLAQAIKAYNEKTELAKQLSDNMTLLAAERRNRTRMWNAMRKYVARSTSTLFNEYLQEKGASGEVTFDFEDSKLGLTYQKDNADEDTQCSDVKLLSGGERSFATLALLLALGSGHECPFRVMDEFDVFMDAMSRNIAISQVIQFARKHNNRQFILITPQDLSSVTPSETCRIVKMRPPRKEDHNQSTLNFGAGSA